MGGNNEHTYTVYCRTFGGVNCSEFAGSSSNRTLARFNLDTSIGIIANDVCKAREVGFTKTRDLQARGYLLATKPGSSAGWPRSTWKKLGQIILRESGGCPNRAGGDMVDENCNITGVSEWNHRSDTGLLQINGVHWKQDHAQYHGLICKRLGVCEQSILLDPLTNLIAGKLLYDVAGWSPWDIG